MTYKPRKNKTKSGTPLLIAGAGLALLALATFLFSRHSPQLVASTKTPESQHSVEGIFPEISRVSLADSKAAFENGKAIFIDVRAAIDYDEGHIPGALSIPLAELEARLNELEPFQWIIPYCSWANEESSARAARILLDNGFVNVTPLLGGFIEWQGWNYPVESGK